ncbi:hypothetical protein RhiLY_06848 [Ceratobasidium sp. AG-Ba]|nr:hypothetical protein RhiLY_06848 [Ceratobasidium sp. AG-Ba]
MSSMNCNACSLPQRSFTRAKCLHSRKRALCNTLQKVEAERQGLVRKLANQLADGLEAKRWTLAEEHEVKDQISRFHVQIKTQREQNCETVEQLVCLRQLLSSCQDDLTYARQNLLFDNTNDDSWNPTPPSPKTVPLFTSIQDSLSSYYQNLRLFWFSAFSSPSKSQDGESRGEDFWRSGFASYANLLTDMRWKR